MKRGRPKDKDPKKAVNTRLRESIIKQLRSIANEQKRSMATLIEIAVEEKYL